MRNPLLGKKYDYAPAAIVELALLAGVWGTLNTLVYWDARFRTTALIVFLAVGAMVALIFGATVKRVMYKAAGESENAKALLDTHVVSVRRFLFLNLVGMSVVMVSCVLVIPFVEAQQTMYVISFTWPLITMSIVLSSRVFAAFYRASTVDAKPVLPPVKL